MSQLGFSNFFSAYLDGQGGIHVQDYNGTRQIGVSLEKHREMEAVATEALTKADQYHKQLVDAGLIKPVLSTEEKVSALTDQVSILTQQLSKLLSQGVRNELSESRKDTATAKQPMDAENRTGTKDSGTIQSDKKRS